MGIPILRIFDQNIDCGYSLKPSRFKFPSRLFHLYNTGRTVGDEHGTIT